MQPEQKKGFLNFLFYNNAVPIVFTIFFLSVGAAAASTDVVQDAVIQETETVQSIDNEYIRFIDLETFKIYLVIGSIVEDEYTYLVRYSYNSIGIEDFVWKPITVSKTLSVSKEALGERDLGLYVAEQLGQVVDFEMQYLRDAQKIERALGQTQKVVVKEYAGLVGKMFDAEAQVFAGYEPVIEEKVESVVEPQVTAGGIGSTSLGEADRIAIEEEKRRVEAERHKAWLKEQEKLREEAEQRPPVEEQVRDILEDQEEDPAENETGTSTSTTTPAEDPEPDTSTTTPDGGGGGDTPSDPQPEPEPEPEPPVENPEPEPTPEPEPEPEPTPEPEEPTEEEPAEESAPETETPAA